MNLFANLIHFFMPSLPFTPLLQTLGWWLVLQLFALAAVPLVFVIFRNTPDRGWALSKSAGLLAVTYITWLTGSSHVIPYTRGSILFAVLFLAFAGVAAWVAFIPKRPRWILTFLKARWRYILAVEIAFLYMLLFFANVRTFTPEAMYDPGRSGAEKFGNMTHLQSIYHTRFFPPSDCWFAGLPLNYYYMGHLQMASVGKFAGIGPEIAFNLGLATIVALTFLNAFGLTYWLTRRIGWAIAAGWAVTVFGNIDGMQQFFINFSAAWRETASLPESHLFAALNKATFHPYFDFWRTSRIVHHTITELPWFSAILGDLHPHHMSLSNWLLTLGVLLAFWRSPGQMKWTRQVFANWPRLILLALLYGLCNTINSWDMVTLMGCIIAVLTAKAALNFRPRLTSVLWWFGGNVGLLIVLIALGSQIFVAPFIMTFHAPMETGLSTFQLLPRYLRTWLSDYFVHFGLFLAPILVEIALLTWNRLKLERQRRQADSGVSGMALILGVSGGALLLGKALSGYYLPGFCVATMILAVYLAVSQRQSGETGWTPAVLSLFVFCQTVVLFVEFFYVNDRYAGTLERYNTLFKFWYPLWPVYGVVAGWAAWRLQRRIPCGLRQPKDAKNQKSQASPSWRNRLTRVWQRIPSDGWVPRLAFWGAAIFIFAAGMTYPLGSTANRTGIFNSNRLEQIKNMESRAGAANETRFKQLRQSTVRTLDARAYMAAEPDGLSDDYEIMKWLVQYEKGGARILEANKHGSSYGPWGRMATMTGNKTLVGWGHHEHQWRPDEQFHDLLNPMMIDTLKIYQTLDQAEAMALIEKHKLDYVMVGGLEKKEYKPEQLKKFEDMLELAVESGGSRLYRVRKPAQ